MPDEFSGGELEKLPEPVVEVEPTAEQQVPPLRSTAFRSGRDDRFVWGEEEETAGPSAALRSGRDDRLVSGEEEGTAGPSTALRFGRDDNSVWGEEKATADSLGSRRVPNFGHTVLFFTITIVVLLLSGLSILAVAMRLHLMGTETPEQLLREPRVVIPSMGFAYLVTGAILWAVFTWIWQRPFVVGVQWNFAVVRRHWGRLLAGGAALSVVVQLLSYFLPVPKSLPIDDFFRTSGDVWMVALFGTLVAPLFEELAFRGFLLPSLASAWDWVRGSGAKGPEQGWSVPALVVSCALTSVAFALVHADQLAHAWAPLSVLFGVSLVLCGVRLGTKSLAASTFIHATYNGTIFTILFFGTDGFRHLDKIK